MNGNQNMQFSPDPLSNPNLYNQPPVNNQPPMNNQMPMGGQMPMNTQSPMNRPSRFRFSSFVSKIIIGIAMLLLVALLVFVIMYSTGKLDSIKKEEVKTIEENTNKVDDESSGKTSTGDLVENNDSDNLSGYIKRIDKACESLNPDGSYGASKDPSCTDLFCMILDNPVCASKLCMISNGEEVYTKDCITGTVNTIDKISLQASLYMNQACNLLDEEGNYSGTYGVCEKAICELTLEGNKFKKDCTKK